MLSVNYRSGIGYGRSFRARRTRKARGNSEYQDVLAGAKYLQSRADVDPARVGIWGLSYGGLLTAQALARNSDIFVAGVDLAGVHLYGSSLDSTNARVPVVGGRRTSTPGSRRCSSCMATTTATSTSRRRSVSSTCCARTTSIYELTVIPDDVARVADPQPLDGHLQPQQRLPPPVRVGCTNAAGHDERPSGSK